MKGYRDELDEKIRKAAPQMKRQEPVSCPHEETLVCYLEGRLDEKERDEIEGHLASCTSCCDQVIAMNRVMHAKEEAPPVSEKAIQKAMDLVDEHPLGTLGTPVSREAEVSESAYSRFSWKPWGYGVAAAVIGVFLISLIPYILKTPILGVGKLSRPLELSIRVMGKKRFYPKRILPSIPSRKLPSAKVPVAKAPLPKLRSDTPEFSKAIIEDDDILRSHDGFQIHFETNRDAYAYVILYSSRGQTELLFPSSEINISNNIQGGQSYKLPSEDIWFVLDEDTAIKTVFVLTSQRPIHDIDTFIESLQNKDRNRVKHMLARKADVVKSLTFRHIEMKE